MSTNFAKKPHAVLVPFPAQGHLIPMMQLAKLLHSNGFYITFVNTEFNHRRLIRLKGSDVKGFQDFKFETISEGLPPSDRDATQNPVALCESIKKNCFYFFQSFLSKHVSSNEFPRVTCIISDGMMSFVIKAGEEFGIPVVQLWTASACGFMGYLQYHELIKRGIIPFKDENFLENSLLDRPVMKDLPSFIRTTDPDDILLNYLGDEAQNCLKASAIIVNTLDDLEQEVLEAVSAISPPLYTVGPLTLLSRDMPENPVNSFKPNLWKEDKNCLSWLDKQAQNSVIYVNYGSVTIISDQHLKEFALQIVSIHFCGLFGLILQWGNQQHCLEIFLKKPRIAVCSQAGVP